MPLTHAEAQSSLLWAVTSSTAAGRARPLCAFGICQLSPGCRTLAVLLHSLCDMLPVPVCICLVFSFASLLSPEASPLTYACGSPPKHLWLFLSESDGCVCLCGISVNLSVWVQVWFTCLSHPGSSTFSFLLLEVFHVCPSAAPAEQEREFDCIIVFVFKPHSFLQDHSYMPFLNYFRTCLFVKVEKPRST